MHGYGTYTLHAKYSYFFNQSNTYINENVNAFIIQAFEVTMLRTCL
jgi:adenine-specific DNA glycosylase